MRSRYFPPRSCQTGTPHALPARSQQATSIPETPREGDAVLEGDVAEVVDGDRDVVADFGADVGHVLFEEVESLLCDVDAGEGMRRVEEVVGLAAHGAGID